MSKPLFGVRVVTLAVNLPGPLAAARLAELGAAVTKIEPLKGDPLAEAAPAWYAELAAGQQVLRLDWKLAAGRAALGEHLGPADLLITAMRPSAFRRLGLERDMPRRLSHIEIVGHDRAAEDKPGHDLTYQAAYGTLQPPAMPSVPVADLLGAERAVSSALLALLCTVRTGVGARYRVVLEEAAVAAGAAARYGLMGGPDTPLGGATPSYGIYASRDGHVALGALEPHFRERVLSSLQARHTREDLARVFAARSTAEWEEFAEAMDIPLAGVRQPNRGDE